ncbi:ATP-binding protein [Chitinophaga sp.]|uniref:ATP-binding protein n=1 Tax=Chitinophaga sp. TaxID=1869181 RepID=UPI0031DF58B8
MFSQSLNKIKRTGLTAAVEEDDARKIMVVNSFSFLTALLCTFCGIYLSVISGYWMIFYTAMAFVCGFLSILLFNSKRRFAAAKFGLQFVFCSVMLYYGCLFGESTQVHFLGLFLIGVPLLICSRKERALRCLCLTMPLLTLFLLETNYYYQVFTPMEMDRSTTYMFRWLIMTVVVILNFMVITFHQQNITNLLQRLHRRAESLRRRNQVVLQKENELKKANRLLEHYNEKLEWEVEQRTGELKTNNIIQEKMLVDLNRSMDQLREKDAELESYVKELETLKSSLVAARDEAERANAAKSVFLRELSHEIRNPLNAIIGISYLLLNDQHNRNKIPLSIVNYIENISTSGHNLLEIINNVLELARIEAGKTDNICEAPFVLREWAHSVASVYQHAARVKDVSIHVQIDHKLPVQLLGDRVHLTQVVNNLLANAVKFTPAQKKVTLSCFREGADAWCIRVTDEGEGIPGEKQLLIFQPFEQADASIHRRFGGTGLGLAISKRIAELLGGQITVWSQQGAGTSFTVTLPLRQGIAVQIPGGEPVAAEKRPQADKKVLLMEDNAVNRMVMQEFFQYLGMPLLMADNGEDGLQMARRHLPDMIILDMHMPRLTGREVIHAIRQDPVLQHVPLVVISADAFREQQELALREGVNEYLIKPVQFDELRRVIDKYFSSAVLGKALAAGTC